jgi:hypothetical protein
MTKFWGIPTFQVPLNTKCDVRNTHCLSLCLFGCICSSLAPEPLEGFCSYSIYKSLLMNTNIPARKVGTNQMSLKQQLGDFSKMFLTIIINFI